MVVGNCSEYRPVGVLSVGGFFVRLPHFKVWGGSCVNEKCRKLSMSLLRTRLNLSGVKSRRELDVDIDML